MRSPLKFYSISSKIQQAIEITVPPIRRHAHVRFVLPVFCLAMSICRSIMYLLKSLRF